MICEEWLLVRAESSFQITSGGSVAYHDLEVLPHEDTRIEEKGINLSGKHTPGRTSYYSTIHCPQWMPTPALSPLVVTDIMGMLI